MSISATAVVRRCSLQRFGPGGELGGRLEGSDGLRRGAVPHSARALRHPGCNSPTPKTNPHRRRRPESDEGVRRNDALRRSAQRSGLASKEGSQLGEHYELLRGPGLWETERARAWRIFAMRLSLLAPGTGNGDGVSDRPPRCYSQPTSSTGSGCCSDRSNATARATTASSPIAWPCRAATPGRRGGRSLYPRGVGSIWGTEQGALPRRKRPCRGRRREIAGEPGVRETRGKVGPSFQAPPRPLEDQSVGQRRGGPKALERARSG